MLYITWYLFILCYVLGLLRPESVEVTLSASIKYFPPPKNYDRKCTLSMTTICTLIQFNLIHEDV